MWAHAIKCKGDMRTAAVIAGAAQLLFGIFVIAPQIFGTGFFSGPSETAFSTFTVIGCLLLAIFFFGIVATPAPNLSGSVRIASLIAAAALAVENLRSTYGTIRVVANIASESLDWKYHPFRQFAHVLGTAMPTLVVITLGVFLFVVFARSLKTQDWKPGERSNFVGLTSFMVAAVFVIALVETFISVMLAPRPLRASVMRLLLRFATLASLIVFFYVFGVRQRRDQN
jgi:hypothetical protein